MSDRSVHPATPRCRRISWSHGQRRLDPHTRWTCSCGASGSVQDPAAVTTTTPTKEKR